MSKTALLTRHPCVSTLQALNDKVIGDDLLNFVTDFKTRHPNSDIRISQGTDTITFPEDERENISQAITTYGYHLFYTRKSDRPITPVTLFTAPV